jgi:hypothetical protein
VYGIKAKPEFNRMLISTENILKLEAETLSKLNQFEDENKKDLSRHR